MDVRAESYVCEWDIMLLENIQDDMGYIEDASAPNPSHALYIGPSFAKILIRTFLANLLTNNDETIGATSFKALAMVDVYIL